MNQNTFIYQYSASKNAEVEKIRKKYLPQEGKFGELERLDNAVQNAGIMETLRFSHIQFIVRSFMKRKMNLHQKYLNWH